MARSMDGLICTARGSLQPCVAQFSSPMPHADLSRDLRGAMMPEAATGTWISIGMKSEARKANTLPGPPRISSCSACAGSPSRDAFSRRHTKGSREGSPRGACHLKGERG